MFPIQITKIISVVVYWNHPPFANSVLLRQRHLCDRTIKKAQVRCIIIQPETTNIIARLCGKTHTNSMIYSPESRNDFTVSG